MFKRKLTYSDLLMIALNLIPLYGVWFEGWDPKQMFLVYCCETILIGVVNVLRMAAITLYKKKEVWNTGAEGEQSMQSGWFFIFFFIIHYGFFVTIQLNIFSAVSGLADTGFLSIYGSLWHKMDEHARLMLWLFFAGHLLQAAYEMVIKGGYKTASLGVVMFQPYIRIVVQQFVVILGSMFLTFGFGKVFMLVFVIILIWAGVLFPFDRMLSLIERRQRMKQERGNPQ